MNPIEATRQQLDPAGTFGAYRSTAILGVVAIIWAGANSLIESDSAESSALVLSALLLIVIAVIWLLWAANPLRAPFGRRSMVAIFALSIAAGACAAFATFGHDGIGDDWVPVAIGVLTIAITPYRPARELVICLAAVTLVLSVTMLLELPRSGRDGSGLALIIAGLSPMLAVSGAAIQYSRYLVEGLRNWQRRADVAAASLASDMVGGVATSIEREHLSILSRDVAPFFTGLLERGTLTDDDRATARAIADSMRGVMVADANRTWLTMAFRDTARGAEFLTVDDESFVAGYMDARQRTAVRAILVAMIEDERVSAVDVAIRPVDEAVGVSIAASVETGIPSTVSADYDTYFSVLRVVFDSFRVDIEEQTVIARFDYDRS